ncbi:MAG TPA: hypothetical protein VG225_06440 [Terracidiphilus sp.]|jgi:acyl carrier protein|nr:hypothetical protein [Terracidiphilus sp.]
MGLDEPELILRIEDEFGISIGDDEAAKARTVGDLYQLALSKLDTAPHCVSSRAFYRTRKALAQGLEMPPRSIRPSTCLEPLMPRESRIEQWRAVARHSGLRFPQLRHSQTWKDRFLLLSMALSAIPVLAVWWSLYALGWLPGITLWLFAVPAFIAWVVLISRIHQMLLNATPRLAYDVPFRTAGELAMGVLAMNEGEFHPFGKGNKPPLKEIVWARMVEIFRDQLKIEPDEVVANARIAEDLGVS